jgi:alcohol dehydrogenase (cytochrome c)
MPIVYHRRDVRNNTRTRSGPLDARTGRLIGSTKDGPPPRKGEPSNRGAPPGNHGRPRVSAPRPTSTWWRSDRRTGAVPLSWQKGNTEYIEDGIKCSGSPLALKDKVLVGVAGGDTGMRGYIAALSASTGEGAVANAHHSRQGGAWFG